MNDENPTVPLHFLESLLPGWQAALDAVDACWKDREHSAEWLRAREAIIHEMRKIEELRRLSLWIYSATVRAPLEELATPLQGRSKKTRRALR